MDKLVLFLFIFGTVSVFTTNVSSSKHRKKQHAPSPMPQFNWPKPDQDLNQYPHESSCHHYYLVLSEEDVSVEKCPEGQLFDYFEHECTGKEHARCWSRHFKKYAHLLHHHKLKDPSKCPYFWGKFPDVKNCTMYYMCLNGEGKHKRCAPFEHFDKITRQCVGTIYGACADESDVVEDGYKCPHPWGSFSFRKDCSKYYECFQRRPTVRSCPKDMLFDKDTRKCAPMQIVQCKSRPNPYEVKGMTEEIVEKVKENSGTTIFPRLPLSTGISHQSSMSEKFSKHDSLGSESTIPSSQVPRLISLQPGKVSSDKPHENPESSAEPTERASDIVPNEKQHKDTESVFEPTKPSSDAVTSEKQHEDTKLSTGSTERTSDVSSNEKLHKDTESSPEATEPSSDVVSNEEHHEGSESSKPTELSSVYSSNEFVDTKHDDKFIKSSDGTEIKDTSSVENDKATKPTAELTATSVASRDDKEKETKGRKDLVNGLTGTPSIASEDFNDIFANVKLDRNENENTPLGKHTADNNSKPTLRSRESLKPTTSPDSRTCPPKMCVKEFDGSVTRCPESDGIYPHPKDERRFLECVDYRIKVYECPGNSIFNAAKKRCKWSFIL